MANEKALALVIRLVDFSETSRVVTFFTREFGKLGALAKGGRRLRGPFAGALDLLSVCRIVLIRKHSSSLDLVTEAELEKGFAPQRNSLQVLYTGYYFAELLLELTDEDDPHPQLFDAAVAALRDLEAERDVRMVRKRFELMVLRETGHMPELDHCVSCGRDVRRDGSIWFSAASGGLACQGCASAVRTPLRLTSGSLKCLQLLANRDSNAWQRLQLEAGSEREISAVTRSAITYLAGRELRTAQFLSS